MVEVMLPPMTTAARGARVSAPAPLPSRMGSMAKTRAPVVIRMGRSRKRPASAKASLRPYPCSRRSSLVKSTSRMAFLVTIPVSRMIPNRDIMLRV